MISEKALTKMYSRYNFDMIESTINNIHHITYIMNSKKYGCIGRIVISRRLNESIWMVCGVKCSIKGIGKLLYYHVMNSVYPCCLTHDEAIVSDKAMRVWNGIKLTSYVDREYSTSLMRFVYKYKLN